MTPPLEHRNSVRSRRRPPDVKVSLSLASAGEGNTHIIIKVTTPRRSKRLDGENLTLFHLCLVRVLHEWDGFPTVDAVVFNIVCGDVPNWLNREGLATDLNLVALHRLLDGSAHIADTNVDSSSLGTIVSYCNSSSIVYGEIFTLIPALVASLTAARRLSYVGSKDMVKALSIIHPLMWTP